MKIELIPIRGTERPAVFVTGEVLEIDGARYDFSALPEGGTEETGDPWIAGPVRRVGGTVVVPLLLTHGFDAPEETRFPQPLEGLEDGPVPLPPASLPAAEAPEDPGAGFEG